ncbi:HlyD family type I secretion periplasmic adaptor subunit [Campylobacter mucosalis]|uniref:HlyD family type I secretion periplasmic adaptor subunit n=1 Tax=Campylobacter mucosalis TaxID=202 RepID=UPI0014703251|nr:HlyD family type I secretion periplasmic adaptor subunit [Campylobacter mucosalis]
MQEQDKVKQDEIKEQIVGSTPEVSEKKEEQRQPVDIKTQENSSASITDSVKSIRESIKKKDYDAYDIRFMSSLSEAVLAKTPSNSKKVLYAVAFTVIWLIVWASQAEIDEITRGTGKIIPSGKNQAIQNLEGGIVEQIFVREGDEVKKDQVILKIDNKNFSSSYGESQLRLDELNAKFLRLEAEANDREFSEETTKDFNNTRAITYELSLYASNQERLREQIQILNEQISQRKSELNELQNKIAQTQTSYNLALKEKSITEPLFRKGLVSEIEYIQLQRKLSDLKGELDAAKLSIPRIESTIKEVENKISEARAAFRSDAKKQLTEVSAEISRINESQINLSDRVERTFVRSPVDGIVSKLMVNTVSGVIKPGENIAEIVPLEDKLVAEIKVKPADVAFLRPGLSTMVKFTAYDFSVYGGLTGKVTQISADTETNEKTGESHYLVRIETDKNYLGSEEKPLRIKVGMVVNADIITGKKTILDYLLKPILKAKQNALTER